MELTGNYRHELKYQIGPADHLALRQRLKAVMQQDLHTGADGRYTIRSVYFDNYRDKALREKVDGVQRREKFRIRYYNEDLSFITLEKKLKHNDLCMKVDAPLTAEDYRRILQAPGPWMLEHPQPLVRELCCKMKTQQLRPRVLVSYVREPYVYAAGNVRVTFDSNIRTSLFQREFLNGALPDIIATDAPGVLYSSGFALTLVGLSLVTTLVIMAVTSNVVLSLGMVGALSIVRFRTAIKEPVEIVFLFWSLAVGIVIGAGMIPLAVIGSAIIGVILLLFANRKIHNDPYILVTNCTDENAENAVMDILGKEAEHCVVKSKTVTTSGIELTAELRTKTASTAFVNAIAQLPGVETATLVSYNGEYLS